MFNNVQFTRLKYQIVRLVVQMPKIYAFKKFEHPALKQLHYLNVVPDSSAKST